MTDSVLKLPGKFIPMPINEKIKCCKFYYDRHDSVCVIVLDEKKKLWTISHGSPYNHKDIDGVNNGYNVTARKVVVALYNLGLWSKEEAYAFDKQQWDNDIQRHEERKVQEAKDLLLSLNYRVTPPTPFGQCETK